VSVAGSLHAALRSEPGSFMKTKLDKPIWVDALEESLLLAISLFALITWVVIIAVLGH
jgi:hypothetical protein